MAPSRQIAAWSLFWAAGVITWLIDRYGWMLEWQYLALSGLAIISVGLAVWVLKLNKPDRRTISLVIAGLVIGQWWLLSTILVVGLWSMGRGLGG